MKEISKREQKKIEKIREENIRKFDEEYKTNKKIPKDYKKSIINRLLKNSIIAIAIIIYLILINILSLKIETDIYIFSIKILCVLLSIASIIFFEISYRKDNGNLFTYGAEILAIATITLFSVYAYSLFYIKYNNILWVILLIIGIYYIIKTIITILNMRKKYFKEQNDIKEIIKK